MRREFPLFAWVFLSVLSNPVPMFTQTDVPNTPHLSFECSAHRLELVGNDSGARECLQHEIWFALEFCGAGLGEYWFNAIHVSPVRDPSLYR